MGKYACELLFVKIGDSMAESNDIEVSIICNTYNHEQYIRKAIEGFLAQETSFSFEVLIHDDASTDGTADIIREYEKKYPDIIRPIYQKENQYSQKVKIERQFQYPRARGKYFAFCEGDDYWIDKHKLQKQYDEMEKHPEIDICAHAVYKEKSGKQMGGISPRNEICIVNVDDVILGGGGFVGTSSLFIRKSLFLDMPRFAQYSALDYFMQIWGALRGGMLFLPEYMSVYNMEVTGSWSQRMNIEHEKYYAHCERVIEVLRVLDEDTEGKHRNAIEAHIKGIEFQLLIMQHKYRELMGVKYRELYRGLPLPARIKLKIKRIKHVILSRGSV